jgi:hypothetical protein
MPGLNSNNEGYFLKYMVFLLISKSDLTQLGIYHYIPAGKRLSFFNSFFL